MIETLLPQIGTTGIDRPLLVFIIGVHLILGATLMFGVFWLAEYQLRVALAAGIATVGVILAVEGWLGPRVFNITLDQTRLLIQFAAGGGIAGATIVGIIFTPNVTA